MKNLIKNLQATNRDLKALSKKVDKIIVQVDKLEKPKSAKKPKTKAKPAKKVVAKKTAKMPRIIFRFRVDKSACPKRITPPMIITPLIALAPDISGVCNTEGTFDITSMPKKIDNTIMNIED